MSQDGFVFGAITSTETLTFINPCPSHSPLVTIGKIELISVGCSKTRGHDGDHEWTLSWKDESR